MFSMVELVLDLITKSDQFWTKRRDCSQGGVGRRREDVDGARPAASSNHEADRIIELVESPPYAFRSGPVDGDPIRLRGDNGHNWETPPPWIFRFIWESNQHHSVSFKRLDPWGPHHNPLPLSGRSRGGAQGKSLTACYFIYSMELGWWREEGCNALMNKKTKERRKRNGDALHLYSYSFEVVTIKLLSTGHRLWLHPYIE